MKQLTLPITFSQNDPRWRNSPMGTKGTIGMYGCLMTDAAMVLNYYGFQETPMTLNEKLAANGGYLSGNLFVWGAGPKLFSGIKYSGQWSNDAPLTKEQMDQIRGAIDRGFPVFIQIDTIPSTSAFDEHWVLGIGHEGDDILVQDPWDGATKRITSWGVMPQKLIYAWCWYEGKPAKQDVAEGCLIPNTPEWRVKYEQLIASAVKWAETLKLFEITDDPNVTPPDRIKSIIGGYKSRETDLNNKLNDKQKQLDVAATEIENRKEQVGRLEKVVLDKEKYYKSLVDALNKQIKNGSEALPLAQGRIRVLEQELDEANKAKGRALLEAQDSKSQLESCQKGTITPTPQLIFSLLIRYIGNNIRTKGGDNHG